jgi:prepilin-type N-terminal cleavage/methylation domain-containing protein
VIKKREGFTLIELIFSMVIIALVFTVIPKIIYAFNKSDQFSIREDALFNAVSLDNMISRLPWDENNTLHNDILLTDSSNGNFDCNTTTYYRVGGFVGSRNCKNALKASAISNDGESDPAFFNDFDDFNDINISAKTGTDTLYTLLNKVFYALDDSSVFKYDYANNSATIHLENLSESNNSTNLKMLKTDVYYSGKRGKVRQISNFYYISSNIGQVLIKKKSW